MSYLGLLLGFKIGITALLASIPLLLARRDLLLARTRANEAAAPWLRLYGVAITALLVGYASGFWALAEGRFPWGVIAMGIVSNAGATAFMLASGVARATPLRTGIFAAIAIALTAAAVAPSAALVRVF